MLRKKASEKPKKDKKEKKKKKSSSSSLLGVQLLVFCLAILSRSDADTEPFGGARALRDSDSDSDTGKKKRRTTKKPRSA